MNWKRFLAASLACWVLAAMGSPSRAQEEPEPEEPPQEEPAEPPGVEPPAAEPTEIAKPRFWGNRFALYVEAVYGSGEAEDLNTSLVTTVKASALNTLSLDDQVFGRVTVGWQLPANRGRFLATVTGFKEDSYDFQSIGMQGFVAGSSLTPTSQVPWWKVSAANGVLRAERNPPLWSTAADANGNGLPDPAEITFAPTPDRTIVEGVPDNLLNRLQTIDLLYQRDFGGRRVAGRWTSGVRYFIFEGNLPAGAWLTGSPDFRGDGFTEGAVVPLLNFAQDASGIGPMGSMEVHWNLFRQYLTLFAGATFAFVLESVEGDTGDFFTLARDPTQGVLLPAPARLTESRNKSAWHLGIEFGARVRLAEGFHLQLSYDRTSYQDIVIVPFSVTLPANRQEAPQGSVALYTTKDMEYSSARLGLSFQF